MGTDLAKIKRRIVSIEGTKKLTKAMELIAMVKVKRFRDASDHDRLYSSEYESLMAELFAHDEETGSHYGHPNEGSLPVLYLAFSSNLGLCGAYNNTLFKYIDSVVKPTDFLATIGSKAANHYARNGRYPNLIRDEEALNLSLDFEAIHGVCLKLKDAFNEKKYQRICLLYTHYVNSIAFAPMTFQLLPVQLPQKKWKNEEFCPPLFDETPRLLIHRLMPYYLASVFFDKLMDSQLSEQASRRTAMSAASDNADDLLKTLRIEYNKDRQAAITQEISEVTGGAKAYDK